MQIGHVRLSLCVWIFIDTYNLIFDNKNILQAVTSKSPPKPPKKSVEQSSCSSLVDLLHFKSSSEQSPRSTPSNSRRSSNGPTSSHSTKPVSPASLRKRSCASDLIMVNPDQCTGRDANERGLG